MNSVIRMSPAMANLVVLLSLLWGPLSFVSANYPSLIIIRDSASFVEALVELAAIGRTPPGTAQAETTSRTALLLTQDIKVGPEDWPPETLSNPLVLNINVTVMGSVPGALGAYPVFDLSWSYRRVTLGQGVSLALERVVVRNFRSKFGNDFDLLTYSDPSWGSLLVLRDSILEFPLCIAAAAVVPGIARVPRSSRAPPAPGANNSAGMFQVTAIWPGGTYCYLSTASETVCTFDGARYLDVWVQVPVLGDFQGGGGYDAWYYNTTRSCVAMASADCVAKLGAGVCYNNAVFDLQNPNSQSGDAGPRLHIILPTVIVGSLLVLGVLSLLGCLVVAPLSHSLMRRRRRLSAPRAGPETTIAVTDIEGSTPAWEVLPSEVMNQALSLHHECVRQALRKHYGTEFATEDSFLIAFHDPASALRFAADLQRTLLELPWPPPLLQLPGQRPVWLRRPAPRRVAPSPAAAAAGGRPPLQLSPSGRVASLGPPTAAASFAVGGGLAVVLQGMKVRAASDSALTRTADEEDGAMDMWRVAEAEAAPRSRPDRKWRDWLRGGCCCAAEDSGGGGGGLVRRRGGGGGGRRSRQRWSVLPSSELSAVRPAGGSSFCALAGNAAVGDRARTYLELVGDMWQPVDDEAGAAAGPGGGGGGGGGGGAVAVTTSRPASAASIALPATNAASLGNEGLPSCGTSTVAAAASIIAVTVDGTDAAEVLLPQRATPPVTLRQPSAPAPASAVCVFRGLRVRVGLTSGVAPEDITFGDSSRKVQYGGQPVSYAKAVCDMAQGGMILLTVESFQQLMSCDEELSPDKDSFPLPPLPPVVLLHFGDYVPTDAAWHGGPLPAALYLGLVPELEGRLGLMGALRGVDKVSYGTQDAPLGFLSVVFMRAVGMTSLTSWNRDIASRAHSIFADTARRGLPKHSGYLLELSEGLCLAMFSSSYDAIAWSLSCKDDLLVADWPEELLEHELCEVVEVRTVGGGGGGGGGGVNQLTSVGGGFRRGGGGGPAAASSSGAEASSSSNETSDRTTTTTLLLRGLRIRVGIDCSADVHSGINPATGRMEYRGRVMNRAARIAARATSGCVMCSEEAWMQSQLVKAASHPPPLLVSGDPRSAGQPHAAGGAPSGDIVARKAGCFDLKGVGQMVLYTCDWGKGRLLRAVQPLRSRPQLTAKGLVELRSMDDPKDSDLLLKASGAAGRCSVGVQVDMEPPPPPPLPPLRGSSAAPRLADASTQTADAAYVGDAAAASEVYVSVEKEDQ